MIKIKGQNVHGIGNVNMTAKAVCNGLLWINITYKEKRKGKKPLRKELAIHLDMEEAFNLADGIKNSYKRQMQANFAELIKKNVGIWHC